jgi:hypothetical protein
MTLCYPQLSTGVISQFPITKTFQYRTVTNELPDGSSIRLSDPDAATVSWELRYSGLSSAERDALSSFFASTGGPLKTFLFLDPRGNLLRYSDDLTKSVWSVDGLLRVQLDNRVLKVINTAQTTSGFQQHVKVPAGYTFCGSALVRAGAGSSVNVTAYLSTPAREQASQVAVGPDWSAVAASTVTDADSDDVAFGLRVPAGAVVEVSGLQLEAQPGRSAYKRTTNVSGRFEETRFDQSSLTFRADGLEDYATTVRLTSRVRLP